MRFIVLFFTALLIAAPVFATEPDDDRTGEVRVPLAHYTSLLQQLAETPRPAPAAYAIGQSHVDVTITETGDRTSASVHITTLIETFEDDWTLIPVLPPGTALRQVLVDGRPVQLVEGPAGLSWINDKAGTVNLQLSYTIDVRQSENGFVAPLPIPRAAATTVNLRLPGTGHDLAIVPAAGQQIQEIEGVTHVSASVPATSSILLSWRAPSSRPYAISRALYNGTLGNDSLVWTGRFQVEIFGDETVTLPVMPDDIILNDISVDGAPATVLVEDGHFTTVLDGRGRHEVTVSFQVPIIAGEGPPRAHLRLPRIPVSHFELRLPGRKDVLVSPGGEVVLREEAGETLATAFIPMSENVAFSWREAVPEALRGQVRTNASLYHTVLAEEGVLHARAIALYEITHGETERLELEIPEGAQVNRIIAPSGGISDWAVTPAESVGRKKISVFLERPVSGEFLLEIYYELLLGAEETRPDSIPVPLLSATGVQRQRGMVALLSSQELALRPVSSEKLSVVGENQLPGFLRDQISQTIAHTFKYTDPAASLLVAAVAPERKKGRFDAQIDTLISLGEVTMKGSATLEIDVKSGTLQDLRLEAPANINVLGVTGPSLRGHEVVETENGQAIDLAFTREMEGRFRIEVNYERIMDKDAPENPVATISVTEAEVEHGRIAVEALSAVEVGAAQVEGLSNLDVNELPRQLVLKTTNPILLAYRYVNARPPFKLSLKIIRHREIEVQVAAIESANYNTLVTRDGLAVTTARLMVRNSRRQFLRLALPEGSEIWSVFVDGKPEKPAFAGEGGAEGNRAVLIKMINSAEGFPVDIVYATNLEGMGHFGAISSHLPRPDMVVTHSRWDLFLPVGPRYEPVDGPMDLVLAGRWVNPREAGAGALARASDAYQAQMGQPLRITVPTRGIQFAFEKLYANQSDEEAGFKISYASEDANRAGVLASALAVLLLWAGIAGVALKRFPIPRPAIVACLAVGILLLGGTIGYLGTSPVPASLLALATGLLLAIVWAVAVVLRWRGVRLAARVID